ncbi:LamG domain-containing protein [Streptomyces sp. NPDC002073]
MLQRWRLRHALAAALGAALIGGAFPAHVPTAVAAESAASGVLTLEQRALQKAAETGEPVELTAERTEFATTYANPDGQTFRLDQSVTPIRVKTKDGTWVKPDAALEVRADGTVGPKAAMAQLSFSNGGSSSLVTISRDEHSLALGWPGRLPKPTLDGASAVYADVLPGVDLRMTATVEGFREVLIVKTPEAAENPGLKRIEFELETAQLRVSASKDEGLSAADGNGKPVFQAPPAQMWDSSGKSSAESGPPPVSARSGLAVASGATTTGAAAEDTPTDGPGAGDQTSRLPLHVDADSLAVVPDPRLLTQTDPSAFPLYIDPSVALSDGMEHTLLRSDGYESYGWGNGDDGLGQGVGECGVWGRYGCGPGYVQRLYFEFSPKRLVGKEVLKARFTITEPWAFQCEPRSVWLVRTAGNISSSTTWGNKPGYLDRMGDRWVSAGRGSLCDPNSPTAPIEFSDNPDEGDENFTPTVQAFAAGKFSRLTLELRAEDETDTSAWKRFRNDANLSVDYIARPSKPSAVGIRSGSGKVCSIYSSRPSIVSNPNPELTGTTEIYPGGGDGEKLRVAMLVETRRADGEWIPVREDSSASDFIDMPSPDYVAENFPFTHRFGKKLEENRVYRYRAWTRAFASYSGGTVVRGSAATIGCYFKVDSTAPKAPTVTFGSPYSQCTSTSCTAAGKPGLAGSFTFGPAAGDTTNTSYLYRLSTETTWKEKAGATAAVSITPPTSGTMRLHVLAKDALGQGAENVVDFVVNEGPGPVGTWSFDEATGGPAIDSSTENTALRNNATLSGGAARPNTGRRGMVPQQTLHEDLTLLTDGVDDYAATAGPVIDTRASFTIAAWVRPNNTSSTFSVMGQSGNFMSAVSLSHHAGGTWSVRMPTTDDASANISDHVVTADNPAVPNVWTHLAATYSAESNKLKLYVNGHSQGEDTVTSPVAGTGPMSFGRIKYRGSWTDYFPGRIDEVKAWQDDLAQEAILKDAELLDPVSGKRLVELSGRWDLSKLTGSSYADLSGYGRGLTPSAGVTVRGGALILDGTSGAATAAGPLVDASGSFTVSAETNIDPVKMLANPDHYRAQIVGQRAADGSSWGLWFEKTGKKAVPDDRDPTKLNYVPVGRWHFGELTADGKGVSVESEDLVELGDGTQVTGVYDAQARLSETDPLGTITLYVGGSLGEPLVFTAAAGTGEFAVGKGYVDGKWGSYLPGEVGNISVWSGAMRGVSQIQDDVF